ncbi:phage tail protein [Hoeflea sp.]|uniref:phage tail protein n=1 Tax=Hoeflea sp. TaxID=1940281 RepID=UPI003B516EA0
MTLIAGIKHLRDGIEAQSVLPADMSIVGIVGTAPNADAAKFPVNTAVALDTNDTTLRASLGTTGTIVDALAGISAQLSGGIGAAKCVIVRVADDEDPFEVISNIIGVEANGTGVWALLDAPENLGRTPRLLVVPGFTSQSQNGIADPEITGAGSGGENGTFALAFTGGTGSGAAGTFTVSGGELTSITITNRGVYTVAPSLDFSASTDLTGATATVALEQLANGVCAIMPTICERLKAHFLPEGPTNTRQAYLDWLETVPRSSRIIHPLRQDAKILVSGETVTKPLSPYIIGRYVARDAEFDGKPFHSIANQPINGIVGVSPVIPFSITDENSVGQQDLAVSAGIVFRGDIGVDGSLTDGGFAFWGTDTLSDLSEWVFSNVTRGRDYIELLQVKAVRKYLGRFNLTSQTIQAIFNTLDVQLSELQANGDILGYAVKFDPDVNTEAELRQGNIDITFEAEEPPVLRKVTLRSRRQAAALTALVQNISLQLGTAA